MTRRNIIALLVAIVFAAVFARLGFWQISRLHQRRARNAEVAARFRAAPVPASQLPRDSANAHYRKVIATGTFDLDHQIVLIGRSLNGAPGVDILTPLRLDSGGAILVNRGWVYSPDASTVDIWRWPEPERTRITGYVEEFTTGGPPAAAPARSPNSIRRLDAQQVMRLIPYPIVPYYLVAVPDSAQTEAAGIAPGPGARSQPGRPTRLGYPVLDEGPHKSYAFQWFIFSLIALIGAPMVLFRDRRRAASS
jgi:surfeit locus 1 family protein